MPAENKDYFMCRSVPTRAEPAHLQCVPPKTQIRLFKMQDDLHNDDPLKVALDLGRVDEIIPGHHHCIQPRTGYHSCKFTRTKNSVRIKVRYLVKKGLTTRISTLWEPCNMCTH